MNIEVNALNLNKMDSRILFIARLFLTYNLLNFFYFLFGIFLFYLFLYSNNIQRSYSFLL